MNLLIFTDHRGHNQSNSLYTLARAIAVHPDVKTVWVASRGTASNKEFFEGKSITALTGITVDEHFTYPQNTAFEDASYPIPLEEADAFFLRLPYPVPEQFFSTLKEIAGQRPIINHPDGILKTGNKSFLLTLNNDFTAFMQEVNSIQEIEELSQRMDIVLKPVKSYGGRGIIRILNGTISLGNQEITHTELEHLIHREESPYLAMEYLPEVTKGDKRLFVAGGQILTATLRIPANGSWLANVAQGGSSLETRPTSREQEMVEYLSPILEKEQIFYYGLDTLIGNQGERIVSEINTLSVGGVQAYELVSGNPVSLKFADLFTQEISNQKANNAPHE